MIKFFRKIRQKLFTERKFSKYLLYAVGEIILVVAGILIALSINNANDARKLRDKERTLLSEMSRNLQYDLEDLAYNIRGNSKRILANETILRVLDERLPMHDSLRPYYGNIFGNYQLSENTGAWETVKSVGLDLISADSLRNAITHLYTVRYAYLTNVEKGVDDKYQWETMYPQLLELINMEELWVSAEPVDHNTLMDNRKFKETLKMNLMFRHYTQNLYTSIYDEVKALIEYIDLHVEELNS